MCEKVETKRVRVKRMLYIIPYEAIEILAQHETA